MREERKKILDMLAQGKISAEDAERLLDKLVDGEPADTEETPDADRPCKVKFLRVHVDSTEGDKVNVRVPLALIGTGLKLSAVLPDEVAKKLGESGLDLGKLCELDSAELCEALRDLKVDVDSGDGDVVRVFCE